MIHHISKGVDEALSLIEKRKSKELKYLSTFSKKLDNALKGGIDWNRIITIAGMSGSGKSTMLEQLKQSLYTEELMVLSFEFEMMIEDQVIRTLSSFSELESSEILSIESELSEEHLIELKTKADLLRNKNLYYVSKRLTVDEMKNYISSFIKSGGTDKKYLFTIDHALLVKENEQKKAVDNLYTTLVDLKTSLGEAGYKCIFIILNQLNRDIEYGDRVSNNYLHYPTRNDIFASSSAYFCSDYVFIIHRPSVITGLGDWYGPPRGDKFPKGLPVRCPVNSKKDMVYIHMIKNRFGKLKILSYVENYDLSKLIEFDL